MYNLRNITSEDHNWLVELHNDPLVLKNVTDPTPITLKSHMKWWKSIDGKKQIRKIFTVNNEKSGLCKFYNVDYINNNCVLGADIHENHRGNGYAFFMWNLMLDFCYKDLGLHRVSLTTASYNKVGQHVYKKVGFKVEGMQKQSLLRDNKYYDQVCMYHLREWRK